MNAGISINKPNALRALALSSLFVAVATVTAQDRPSPALLRRSPGSTGVIASSLRSQQSERSVRDERVPAAVVDENVVPASDTTGVNRVRIRAVEPPTDFTPSVPRRTSSSTSSSRTTINNTVTPSTTTPNATEDLPPLPKQTASQVTNRLPPLARAIGTPPASSPLRATTTPAARATGSAVVRNTPSTQARATIASTGDSETTDASTTKSAPSTTAVKKKSPTKSVAKATTPNDNSGAIARGLAYFDPTKIMPWMRQDSSEKSSAPAAETESVVIDDGSAATSTQSMSASQQSPKPKVAQKAKKRSTKAKPTQVAGSDESNNSSGSSFFNPLKSVRQIWSGTEPPAPKGNRVATTKEPVAEEPTDDEAAQEVVPQQKPSMLAQLFGRGRAPEKVITKTKAPKISSEDVEIEIDSSESAGDVAIERKPSRPSASLSDDQVTEIPEAFQAPAPVRQTASLPAAKPPVDPRAANAKLGAPIIELADEEVASTESDRVVR